MTLLLHVSDTHFGTERPEVAEGLVRLAQAQMPAVSYTHLTLPTNSRV